jgi:6-phosphogluconolactonase (cycloisomerase 2 family)
MRLRLLPVLLAAAAVLSSSAAAHALPAGALVPGGAKADCAGGRGAPCATITRGMANPVTGAFSPDGRSLYVGSLGNGGLFSFARDPRTGRLTPVQGGPACIGHQLGCERLAHPMPEAVVVTHDGRFVYTGGAGPDDGLLAFARDVATGALAPAGCFAGLRTPCGFPGGVSTRSDMQALEITPDDRFLVAASVDGIGVVQRDPATGALSHAPGNCVVGDDAATSWDEPSRDCRLDPALGRPLAMDMSADGRFVHVAAEDGGGLHTFALDAATGALRHTGKVKGGFYEVAAAPDGRSVYAVTEDFDLLAFARDPATGALTRIRGPRGRFTVAPGCTYLKGLATPEDVRVTPDGRHVVVAASEGVTVLARDSAGALRHLRGRGTCATIDGTDGLGARPRECLDGDYALGNLTGFEIAPDGRHGYALETEAGGGYAVGVAQVLRRR